MKRCINKGAILLLVLFYALSSVAGSRKKGQQVLICGCAWKEIAIVDKSSGQIIWSHPVLPGEDCNDIERTRKGGILYAYRTGARLIRENHKVVWDYKAPQDAEVYSATELPDGRFLLAMCGKPAQITLLDKKGQLVKNIPFDMDIKNIHNQFRQIETSSRNTYLIPIMGTGHVMEMNQEGNIVRKVFVGGNLFSVKELNNGHWLVGCGDAHCFKEIDPNTETTLRTVNTLKGINLLFVAETVRLDNGNTLLCNWAGHSKDKSQPQLIEVDPHNNVVWTLKNPAIRDISAVWIENSVKK